MNISNKLASNKTILGSTYRLNKLELLPLLDLLNQTDVLQGGPGKVSLLHLQRCVSLQENQSDQAVGR